MDESSIDDAPATLLHLPNAILVEVLGLQRSVANCLVAAGVNQRLRSLAMQHAVARAGQPETLCLSARKGSVAVVGALLSAGADPGAHHGLNRKLALHHAAENGHAAVIQLLARAAAGPVAEQLQGRDALPDTPLVYAAQAGHVAAVQALLAAGADPALTNEQQGQGAMHAAVHRGHLQVVRTLLDAGAVTEQSNRVNPKVDRQCNFMLSAAASGDRYCMLRPLLAAGLASAADANVHEAIYFRKLRFLCAMLITGADPNRRNNENNTPLHRAASHFPPAIPFLLAAGADLFATTPAGRTPMNLAVMAGDEEAIELLLTAGASPHAYVHGMNLVSLAVEKGFAHRVVAILVQRGADVHAASKNGFTALHRAAEHGFVQAVRTLVAAGALVDVEVSPVKGKSPMTFQGWTPLHLAARHGHLEVVQTLLGAGAGAALPTPQGETALDVAKRATAWPYHCKGPRLDAIVELLQKHAVREL